MSNQIEIKMKLAGREWARQFYTAVVKNFSKTVTEPVTNSDTSYKRKYSLHDASGLVDLALSFKKGQKFEFSKLKREIRGKFPQRTIEIHLYTAKGHKYPPRTCEIIDYAEGLNRDKIIAVFNELAADKSEASGGRPGRSLFGRGVSDVLLGHQNGQFFSYYNGILSSATFSFDHKKDNEPRINISSIDKPSINQLKENKFKKNENGSCVRFELHTDCRIPEEGTIVPALAQFYMLRLINADPNVKIKLFRYRSSKAVIEDQLDYDFPMGDVIDKFSFTIKSPVKGENLPSLNIDAIVCRSDGQTKLPGKEAGEQRANGLLIVDDKDAVLDLTLLPQFEGSPFLANIFGIIRISSIREIFTWYLNNGKDSPLSITRDGFDTRHDFTKFLFTELSKFLEPIYKKEEERYNKSLKSDLSKETKERIDQAIKELNKFLKELGSGEGEEPPQSPVPDKAIQFLPTETKLFVGKEKFVKLLVKKEKLKKESYVIIDSDNSQIEVRPLSSSFSDGKDFNEYLAFQVVLKCDTLHSSGIITALTESKDEILEAQMKILDVISELIVIAPDTMEFRPKESKGQPNRSNYASLFINLLKIPVGRKIKLNLEKIHGSIGFNINKEISEKHEIDFNKEHLGKEANVGRIPIPWRSSGWNQSARIIAETKIGGGEIIRAECKILTEQPDESGGMIRECKYVELEDGKCTDLIDGIIYINSKHSVNKMVFGTEIEYKSRMDNDKTAQFRFAALIVEQSVYNYAERNVLDNKLIIDYNAPVTSLRKFIDEKTHEWSPKIFKVLITKN